MTREDFIDNVDSFYELQDFCTEHRLDTVDNVCDRDGWNDEIDERLVDLAREYSWRDLLDTLRGYEDDDGYDYYEYDEYYCRLVPVDFSDLKQRVLEAADEDNVWDEEEEEDNEEEDLTIDEDIIEEGCPFEEMFEESRNYVQSFTERELEIVGEGLRNIRTMVE